MKRMFIALLALSSISTFGKELSLYQRTNMNLCSETLETMRCQLTRETDAERLIQLVEATKNLEQYCDSVTLDDGYVAGYVDGMGYDAGCDTSESVRGYNY